MGATPGRRAVLRAAGGLGVAPLVSGVVGGGPAAAVDRGGAAVPGAWSVRPFALGDVALGEGIFAEKRALMLDHARGYDVDRLVQVFRANAGLDTRGAVAPGGWEGLDGEANGNLRGHYTGHFLTMLAQAHAGTGERVFADKAGAIVGALTEAREALRGAPAVLSVPGRTGAAAENQRGSYQYMELPPAVLGGATAVTVAAWVRPAHDGDWARVFDTGEGTDRYLYLAARSGAGVPRFALTTGGPAGEQAIDGTAPLPLGQWSHLAVTIGDGTGVLYVNGVEAGRNTAMTLTPASLGTVEHAWLGRSPFAADPVFAGAFDAFDLWSRALTAEEIRALHEGTGGGDLVSYGFAETTGGTFADGSGRGLHAALRRTWGGPSHPGFLAAYPETQFITLESMTGSDYHTVWAPYYTAHKILQGLLDAHAHLGDARALDLAAGLGDWMHSRLAPLPRATLQRMWGIFSSGEFGGVVEAIVELYTRTGAPEHLALAKLFDLDSLIDACAADTDVLDGLHANQHIPIFTGLLRLHDVTGEQRYLDAARNFWGMVVPTRMYGIGGTSSAEFWRAPHVIAGTLGDSTAETCCAYNLLKLSRALFLHDQDPRYMDYYERALYNQILGSKQDRADAEKPLVTYFIGLTPGHARDYTPKQGTTCCEGTGIESATKYQDTVYFGSADGGDLYVNLYLASTLEWAGRGVALTQTTDYPREQGSTLTVTRGAATFRLLLRVPSWAGPGFRVTVNGAEAAGTPEPGGYFAVSRTWSQGDRVRIDIPFRLRTESTPDDPGLQSLFLGPVNLVARDDRTSELPVGLYRDAALSGDLLPTLTPVPGTPLHHTLDGVALVPFHEGTQDRTHAYLRRHEPRLVFGGTDSGVANPARPDGSTVLDEIWAGAPFPDKNALVERVRAAVDGAVREGLLSAADGARAVATAEGATYVP
ncbi:hypothetical protein SUDANB171_01461 [Streptomyces sp. enrichment culture]|uniref:beta-L-arabinofuranosidase domain-containing protein n=1 Tax=Streptomyces sp. enrichment culture TaxID=1795815 RepID=UPI003F5509E3